MWFNIFLKHFWTAFNELCQSHSPWGGNTKLNLVFFFFFLTNARGCYDGFKSAQTLSEHEWVNIMTMTVETGAVKLTSWGNSKEKNMMIACCLLALHNNIDWLTYGVGWKPLSNTLMILVCMMVFSVANAANGDRPLIFCKAPKP